MKKICRMLVLFGLILGLMPTAFADETQQTAPLFTAVAARYTIAYAPDLQKSEVDVLLDDYLTTNISWRWGAFRVQNAAGDTVLTFALPYLKEKYNDWYNDYEITQIYFNQGTAAELWLGEGWPIGIAYDGVTNDVCIAAEGDCLEGCGNYLIGRALAFSVGETANVTLYTWNGKKVRTLVNDEFDPAYVYDADHIYLKYSDFEEGNYPYHGSNYGSATYVFLRYTISTNTLEKLGTVEENRQDYLSLVDVRNGVPWVRWDGDDDAFPLWNDSGFADVPDSAYYFDAVKWAVEDEITNGVSAINFKPGAACTRAQAVTFLYRAAGSPAVSGSNAFKDVSADAYYADAVQWAVSKGITKGTTGATFSPDSACTRAQIVTLLYRSAGSSAAAGTNSFTDVPTGVYYEDAVNWAVRESITTGTGNHQFSPGASCTRGQIVTFLYRAAK